MVKVTEVADLFLEVCPAAKPEWEEHLKDWEGEPPAHYIEISVFAHHLVNCYEKSQTQSFTQVFELVERLIVEGDDDTQGVMIVGLLEGLQNIASWRSFGSRVFEPYLGPKSLAVWHELEIIWQGKNSLADVIRAEAKDP
jgi:hypothetical protein